MEFKMDKILLQKMAGNGLERSEPTKHSPDKYDRLKQLAGMAINKKNSNPFSDESPTETDIDSELDSEDTLGVDDLPPSDDNLGTESRPCPKCGYSGDDHEDSSEEDDFSKDDSSVSEFDDAPPSDDVGSVGAEEDEFVRIGEAKHYDAVDATVFSAKDAGVHDKDDNSGIKQQREEKVKVPASVKSNVDRRIKELNDSIKKYDNKGYDDKSVKQQAIDCLNKIMDNLKSGDTEGLNAARNYYGTLMSPLTDLFPSQLINFLTAGEDE
jgi:hypothetical protein